MKKTWVKNIVVAALAVALILGVCGIAQAVEAIVTFSQNEYAIGTLSGSVNTALTWDPTTPSSNYDVTYSIPATATQGVATVDASSGVLTAVKNGTTKVQATVTSNTVQTPANQDTVTISANVVVNVDITVNLSPLPRNITKEETYDARGHLTLTPPGDTVKWTSSSPGVASVDANGKITGVAPGKAVITATSEWDSSKKATLDVTVELPTITVAKPSPASLKKAGETATVTAKLNSKYSPTVVGNSAVSWTSSNTAVATVLGKNSNFNNGNASADITAVGAGTATITCMSGVDGTVLGTTTISVGNVTPGLDYFYADYYTLGYNGASYLYIKVTDPVVSSDGYPWARLRLSSRRIYLTSDYSHLQQSNNKLYYVRLDSDGYAKLIVRPQFSGNMTLYLDTMAPNGSWVQRGSLRFSVNGYPVLPQTGQDFTLIYVLGACCLAAAVTWVIVYAKKKKNDHAA